MTIYRISGDALLRLTTMAAQSPAADVDTILGILHGVDAEEPNLPNIKDGPSVAPIEVDEDTPAKPVKPE